MRGDSIRDLYAKTLALLGLGVLAGTGALVDYWPSGVVLPAVESVLPQASIAGSLPVPRLDRAFFEMTAQVRTARPSARPALADVEEPTDATLPVLVLHELPDVPIIGTLDASESSTPTLIPVAFAGSEEEFFHGEEVSLSDPSFFRPTATLALSAPAVVLSDDDDNGRITGMVKRTGTTLVRTSRKTGASIWEMVRVVSGAVRKALPN